MSQQEHSDKNLLPIPKPMIQQQVENTTLGGGMQAAIGDNIQIQGDSNVVTFNKTEILQISVDEIKTREFIETSPYKGLKKFEPEDKDLFFGRDQFLTSLVNELEQTNLVLLLGASGSGKSSVVRAGLVPWLSRKYGTRLVNLIFTPDQDPFESLYASLLSKNTQNQAQIAREAKADTLTQVVTRLKQADDYWFIFIDQFEELFTTSESEKRDRFIASLLQLAKAKLPSVKIIATMRADFLDKLSPYPALVKATDKHRPLIAEMQLDELRLAIEQPAAHHGVVFETGLVEEIIKDVQGQAGYLPLLQYTLNLLWETEAKIGSINDRTLNISTYRKLGGVRGALQQRVDKIYEDLSAQEKIATQRIFLKLVDVGGDEGSGTEWKPVRRRALRSEFNDELEQGVLVKLINNNLLVSDRPLQSQQSTIEIAHETLLTSWTTLNTWIKENRNSIALRNRLNDDVERWEASKAEDELWAGSKLEKVLELRGDATFNQVFGGFGKTANQFIDASLGLRDRQLRKARIVAVVGVTLAVFAGTTAIFAGYQLRQAAQRRMEQYASAAEALLTNNPTEGLVYAISAFGLSHSPFISFRDAKTPKSVQKSLFNALLSSREENILRVPKAEISSVALSPDGQYIVTGSNDGTVRLWNLKGNIIKRIQVPEAQAHPEVPASISVAFSPNNQHIMVGDVDSTVWLLDLKGNLREGPFKPPKKSMTPTFSPDGQHAISYDRSTPYIWNLRGSSVGMLPQNPKSLVWELFTVEGEGEGYFAFSRDGKQVIGGLFGSINLWELDGSSARKSLPLPEKDGISSAAISPNGQTIVAGTVDGRVRLLNQKGQYISGPSQGHTEQVTSVEFSPNGQRIASASQDGTIQIWNAQPLWDSAPLRPTSKLMRIPTTAVTSVKFTLDGKHFVSFSEDNIVRVWNAQDDLITGEKLQPLGSDSRFSVPSGITSLRAVAFSSDGKHIIARGVGNWGGVVATNLVWNLQGEQVGAEQNINAITNAQTNSVADPSTKLDFSPDGKKIVSISGDDLSVRMYEVALDSWLETACNRLRYHPILTKPATDVAKEARTTCERYVWSNNQSFATRASEVSASPQVEEPAKLPKLPEVTPTSVASQPPPTPAQTTPSPTVSQSPSTSTSSYKFEFPQASCGDKSADPDTAFFPVFIDDRTVEEVRSKYCADAYSVSNRQKTGKPSVQVASFSDRQKAEAFAREVGGEVGEPHSLKQP
ncbi:NACHT domain-containing protein [Scytonema sp. PCC 10023]|uniref:nSTAND1 domain-containing NTPase n=1 Tax=Scytonema sp. PCC 10023 TaxID=1680591 RepID=UPI0039C63810